METKKYLDVLLKWKSIFFLAFGTVVLATALFTLISTPVYEATSKLVILPSANVFTNYNDVRNAITSLDNDYVANTYAEVALSSTILETAQEALGLESLDGYVVTSSVEPKTSLLSLTVEGPDAYMVYALSNMVAVTTAEYVAEYFDVYYLQHLDKAALPDKPISPNVMLNLLLGIVLGLGAGIVLAYLGEYLSE